MSDLTMSVVTIILSLASLVASLLTVAFTAATRWHLGGDVGPRPLMARLVVRPDGTHRF